MFGSDYAVMDQRLKTGKKDRSTYAGELLVELLGRATVFTALVDDYISEDAQSGSEVIFEARRLFQQDIEETCARAGRAGLLIPFENGNAEVGTPEESDVEEVGGLLVGESGAEPEGVKR